LEAGGSSQKDVQIKHTRLKIDLTAFKTYKKLLEEAILSVCVYLGPFDGTVPAQLSLRSPVTGAPHRGAGSSDGRLLPGIYGK